MPLREQWRAAPGYEGRYEVSDLGRVRNPSRAHNDGILSGFVDRYGYRTVLLQSEGTARRFKVHRLVCIAFHGEGRSDQEVGHLDAVRLNNAAENLRWMTRSENMRQAVRDGNLIPPVGKAKSPRPGEANPMSKLTTEQVVAARAAYAAGETGKSIAQRLGISQGSMSRILTGKRWAHVGEADQDTSCLRHRAAARLAPAGFNRLSRCDA